MVYSTISSHSEINVYQYSAPSRRGLMKRRDLVIKYAKKKNCI